MFDELPMRDLPDFSFSFVQSLPPVENSEVAKKEESVNKV